ncbi:MAG: translation elongation factor Ts [Chlamydiales bacterium]|nr:translation elongation factor Ts [Chlamydiales bacterium]
MTQTVTASQVKELRDRTGVGMSKCKEALEEAKGNMDEAIAILRKAGMASAVKKQGRETNEGLICSKETDQVVAFCEINAETDFVVKNDRFQEFCKNIVEEIANTKPASLEAFMAQSYSKDPSVTIDQYRSLIIQTIGENIQISRLAVWQKAKDHSIGIYSHMGGKILTATEVSAPGEVELAREIAMHAAAAAPEYLNPKDVPQDVIVKEREIAKGQVQGKPAEIMDKIVDGKINAYYDQVCLTRQKFIKDTSVTVDQHVQNKAKAAGKTIALTRFLRWTVGQAL